MKELTNKITFIILFITLFSLYGCALDINDTDVQSSSSIADSKKKGVFICEYKVVKCPEEFHINEVWQEKLWFYKNDNPFHYSIEIDSTYSNVYLQLNSSRDSIFSITNIFEKWELINDATQEIAGSIEGRLSVHNSKFLTIDSLISLTLILNPHSDKPDTIGTVILKSIPPHHPQKIDKRP